MSHPRPLWDTEAFSGVHAGHPGRLYRRGPESIVAAFSLLLHGAVPVLGNR